MSSKTGFRSNGRLEHYVISILIQHFASSFRSHLFTIVPTQCQKGSICCVIQQNLESYHPHPSMCKILLYNKTSLAVI